MAENNMTSTEAWLIIQIVEASDILAALNRFPNKNPGLEYTTLLGFLLSLNEDICNEKSGINKFNNTCRVLGYTFPKLLIKNTVVNVKDLIAEKTTMLTKVEKEATAALVIYREYLKHSNPQ